jgi:hypothetical protein
MARSGRTLLMITLIVLGLGVMMNTAASVTLWHNLRVQVDRNNQTTEGVCALRADLERRVALGVKYLETHPNGALGLKPEEIRAGIDNQQRTVTALGDLDCSE